MGYVISETDSGDYNMIKVAKVEQIRLFSGKLSPFLTFKQCGVEDLERAWHPGIYMKSPSVDQQTR